MTLDQALAYLTPHPATGANAPVLLTASTMREAIAVIRAALPSPTDTAASTGGAPPNPGATKP
jgi:hypothetical protein